MEKQNRKEDLCHFSFLRVLLLFREEKGVASWLFWGKEPPSFLVQIRPARFWTQRVETCRCEGAV